ncbi:iron(III) transport system substrate-binding protein [Peptoniphilus koenoeneniae]|jgi:hypothetical protein|uniref:Iron(III) transport system substrate-binding protein n=1 Tax=Peptoniphilus koenoeneniae TaxID=507751 RepID=A0ABU0ATB5_9FIRM|nr:MULTISPECIES: ABC transporter substrate-binding protein [Peptoniphilus]ERT59037.1 ABC transporter, solute-binding protein [Peptoniphilus sp. BV3C26]MDQ0274512.1 iron(III) transport system substrate-binding protein [Peptoniphilus koenoeneniae]
MKKSIIGILLCSILLLSACANGNSKENSKANSENKGENVSDNKKITVYMPSPAKLTEKLTEAFKEESGIEVEVFQGTTGEILARLEAEKANPIADVVGLASWSDGLSLKSQDMLMSYEIKNKDKSVEGWIDEDNELFGYCASAVGIIYNTNAFKDLNADWSELSDPKYKGQIAIPDPEKSGACKDFLAAYIDNFGWDDFENMAKNGLIVPGANKAALESVTTGETGILVAGVDYNAYTSKKKGEPIDIYYPKSGTVVNPRPALILKSAPNPEGAKKFIDFLYSDKAQKMVAEAFLIPGRSDIEMDNRAGLKDIKQIPTNWENMMKIATDSAKKLNSLVAK